MGIEWRTWARDLWTVPNLISLSRLPLFLVLVVVLDSVWRYPVFALIVASDAIDGWVARRLDQTTELGALIDPALDKLTALFVFALLFPRTGLALEYLVLFFARDIFVVGLGALSPLIGMPDSDEIKARPLGKLVTNLQFFTMIGMLVPARLATETLLWGLGVASALAIADYIVFFGRAVTDDGLFHRQTGTAVAYLGVAVVFAVVTALVLREQLVGFLDAVAG